MSGRMLLIAFMLVLLTAVAEGALRKRPAVNEGPDLPYPCVLVRWYASTYTVEQLEIMGKANGVVLSKKQRRQVRECIRNGLLVVPQVSTWS